MKYLAHIQEKTGEEQELKEHLFHTAKLAGVFADKFGAYDLGYCSGILHDVGKYSEDFQRRIRKENIKVDHATAGAQLCYEKAGLYGLLGYCIAGHHAGLPDTGEEIDTGGSSSFCGRMKKKIPDYKAYEGEIKIPEIKAPPFMPVQTENCDFFMSMLIRMLYSCLVDADYLDTEAFMTGNRAKREGGEAFACLYQKLWKYIAPWLENYETDSVNGRRSEILRSCLEQAKEKKGLYRLTVPTGGGKTIASLAFALAHAVTHHMSRIIYVIPYTSIIEQNAQVFREILGEENVLENHCNVEFEGTEELKPMQLAAENWDKPVVVTTNVQFFESFYSSRGSKCRKLHNVADSVIIFDEAQMLPNDYLKPCIAVMEQLLRHYRSTVVLCTATQPALQKLFSSDIQAGERELCPRIQEQFAFFKRNTIKDLGKISEEELIEKLSEEKQVLCILNTKKRVQRVYEQLKGEGVYHLSTAMYPKHRKRILNKIKQALKQGEKCVVIATSLVEAGVDMDFITVFRQLAGLDSVIQAAGRCNREGEHGKEECSVFIFELEGREFQFEQKQKAAITKDVMEDAADISGTEAVRQYFERLYHYQGESLDKKRILDKFKKGRYSFREADREFRIIEQNTKTILIPLEEEAIEILKELRTQGFSRKRIRRAGQYCVQVYEDAFQKMLGAGNIEAVSEKTGDFYVLADKARYREDMGLVMEFEYGQAVIL